MKDTTPELPKELCCPITHQLFYDPVLAADGITYEREALTMYFQSQNRSPMTREKIPTTLIPNVNMKNRVRRLLKEHPEWKNEVYQPNSYDNVMHDEEIRMPTSEQPEMPNSKKLHCFFILLGIIFILATISYSPLVIFDYYHTTPLHVAVKNRNLQEIFQLINAMDNIDPQDEEGMTPLHIALSYKYGARQYPLLTQQIVKMLLKRGANVNLKSKDGKTPLHLAIYLDDKNIFTDLLKYGARVNEVDENGETPLHFAASRNGSISVWYISKLLEHGADVNKKNAFGKTPIFKAVHYIYDTNKKREMIEKANSRRVVKELLFYGANPHATDVEGKSILEEAYVNERFDCLPILQSAMMQHDLM